MKLKLLLTYYESLKMKDNTFFASPYVKLQDLIKNDMTGLGTLAKENLRQFLRGKSRTDGKYLPLFQGAYSISMKELILARTMGKRYEAREEVRDFLRRHGIANPTKNPTTPRPSPALKEVENSEIGEQPTQNLNNTISLEKLIIYRLLGMAPDAQDEVMDFLSRNGVSLSPRQAPN